jgi:hypothetical protein
MPVASGGVPCSSHGIISMASVTLPRARIAARTPAHSSMVPVREPVVGEGLIHRREQRVDEGVFGLHRVEDRHRRRAARQPCLQRWLGAGRSWSSRLGNRLRGRSGRPGDPDLVALTSR